MGDVGNTFENFVSTLYDDFARTLLNKNLNTTQNTFLPDVLIPALP